MSSAFQSYMNGPLDKNEPVPAEMSNPPSIEDFDLRLQMASMSRDEIIDHFITERRDLLERNSEMHQLNLDLLKALKEFKKDA